MKRSSANKAKALALDAGLRGQLRPHVETIHGIMGTETQTIVKIGHQLLQAKAIIRDNSPAWLAWIKEEVRVITDKTAQNYMNAARLCDEHKFEKFSNLSASSLYELAAKRADPEKVRAVLALAEDGPIAHKAVCEALKQDRNPTPKSKPLHGREWAELCLLVFEIVSESELKEQLTEGARHGIKLVLTDGKRNYDPMNDTPPAPQDYAPWEKKPERRSRPNAGPTVGQNFIKHVPDSGAGLNA